MGKLYLSNAFSLNMLSDISLKYRVDIIPMSEEDVRNYLRQNSSFVSVVGHADTASIFEKILAVPVPFNRVSVALESLDCLVVGQYRGSRLPEGCHTLPEGASVEWVLVVVTEQ